jgi:hypothetical protein
MEALNLKPSKVIGEIKEAVKEAILNGDIPNDHDAAFEFMIQNKNHFFKRIRTRLCKTLGFLIATQRSILG